MQEENKLPRRRMLQMSLGATAGLLTVRFGNNSNKPAAADNCPVTPEQDLGPFYPIIQGEDEDVDLTMIKGHTERAAGEVILVRGRILDEECVPIPNALVEIWSANTHGRYHHERDTSAKPLDPNFQGWGEVLTNAAGEYGFKTIKPGAYAIGANVDDPSLWRTPHIHYKVTCRGYHGLITQMYFNNEKLNDTDGVLAELEPVDRSQFIITPTADNAGIPLFTFDIRLKKVGSKKVPTHPLAEYAGTYELPDERENLKVMTIRQDGDYLFLDLVDYTAVELKPHGQDTFLIRPIYRKLVFSRNGEGKVDGVKSFRTSKKSKDMAPAIGKIKA